LDFAKFDEELPEIVLVFGTVSGFGGGIFISISKRRQKQKKTD
jgi:hypothetical protein